MTKKKFLNFAAMIHVCANDNEHTSSSYIDNKNSQTITMSNAGAQ